MITTEQDAQGIELLAGLASVLMVLPRLQALMDACRPLEEQLMLSSIVKLLTVLSHTADRQFDSKVLQPAIADAEERIYTEASSLLDKLLFLIDARNNGFADRASEQHGRPH